MFAIASRPEAARIVGRHRRARLREQIGRVALAPARDELGAREQRIRQLAQVRAVTHRRSSARTRRGRRRPARRVNAAAIGACNAARAASSRRSRVQAHTSCRSSSVVVIRGASAPLGTVGRRALTRRAASPTTSRRRERRPSRSGAVYKGVRRPALARCSRSRSTAPLNVPSAFFVIVELGDRGAVARPSRRLGAARARRGCGQAAKQPVIEKRDRDSVAVADPRPATSLRSAPLIGTQSRYAVNVSPPLARARSPQEPTPTSSWR